VCCSVLQCVADSFITDVLEARILPGLDLRVRYSVLPCVAVCCLCCSVLQCVADSFITDMMEAEISPDMYVCMCVVCVCVCVVACCSVAMCCNVLHNPLSATCLKPKFSRHVYICVLQCLSVCCSMLRVLQCVAVCCSAW